MMTKEELKIHVNESARLLWDAYDLLVQSLTQINCDSDAMNYFKEWEIRQRMSEIAGIANMLGSAASDDCKFLPKKS